MIQNKNDIGIIGAGKVGTALGGYLSAAGLPLSGYYDSVLPCAEDAAERTNTQCYGSLEEIISQNTVMLMTVPDDAIASVWNLCRCFPVAGKTFIHCSGVLSSIVFSEHEKEGVYVGSLHPVCAVSNREAKEVFFGKFFVMEGDAHGIEILKAWMNTTHNEYKIIRSEDKARYHAAAVMSSNLVCALQQMGEDLLKDSGFDAQEAHQLLVPLLLGNVDNIATKGCVEALTGPVERGDAGTVARHLEALDGDMRETYRLLSLKLVALAQQKHPDTHYTNLLNVLKQ